MKILLACEESQTVCIEMRKRGHEAYSCDIQECSGGHPEWHIQGDIMQQLDKGWDMMIAFPPCTYLSNVGNRWFKEDYNLQYDMFNGLVSRAEKRVAAFEFFMQFVNAPIEKIAIENPIGIVQKWYRKHDQIIQPFHYGHDVQKRTCLWLKNIPELKPTNILPKPKPLYRTSTKGKGIQWTESLGFHKDRARLRSKTFLGIAKAMANQWG